MDKTYSLTVREEAEEDVTSAMLWYSSHHPDRIPRFLSAIDDCLAFIQHQPHGPVRIERGYQQFPLRSFPYFVVYRVEGLEVVVVRVFHMKRDPGTKLGRRRGRTHS